MLNLVDSGFLTCKVLRRTLISYLLYIAYSISNVERPIRNESPRPFPYLFVSAFTFKVTESKYPSLETSFLSDISRADSWRV